MSDKSTTIQTLKDQVAAFITERDWNKFHAPKNLSMAIAIEAAELMEKFTWIESADSYKEVDRNRQEIENELADVIILALEFAIMCNIDVSKALTYKIEEIKKKYPIELAKGRSDKYTTYQK